MQLLLNTSHVAKAQRLLSLVQPHTTEGFTQVDVTVKVEGDEGGPQSTTEGDAVSECGSSEWDRWFASGSESNVEG